MGFIRKIRLSVAMWLLNSTRRQAAKLVQEVAASKAQGVDVEDLEREIVEIERRLDVGHQRQQEALLKATQKEISN